MAETEREIAQRRVTEGRRIVAEQHDKVARLRAHGRDMQAQRELELFEDSLAMFEEHLKSLEP